MTHEDEHKRLAFTLSTAQMASIFKSFPVDTKVFGTFDDSEPLYVGKRDTILTTLRAPGQDEDCPTWSQDGEVYIAIELSIQLTMSVFDECTIDDQEFCVLVEFSIAGSHSKPGPELECIPLSEMLKPGMYELSFQQLVSWDVPHTPTKSILAPLSYWYADSDDEIKFEIEDGYYFGNQWRKIASSEHQANLCLVRDRIHEYAGQDHESAIRNMEDGVRLTAAFVGSAISGGVGALVDAARAREFWMSLGLDDSPDIDWVLGFCAGAIWVYEET